MIGRDPRMPIEKGFGSRPDWFREERIMKQPKADKPRHGIIRKLRKLLASSVTVALASTACVAMGLAVPASAEEANADDNSANAAENTDGATVENGAISGARPLSYIGISPDLNCDVRHVEDSSPEFYSGTACGTFVVLENSLHIKTLYGPAYIPAGNSPDVAFTPVSQEHKLSGNTATITTKVKLGDTGVTLTEWDSYEIGRDWYSTKIAVSNSTLTQYNIKIYRAGDCYLQNSDLGYGVEGPGWVGCAAKDSDRVLQWKNKTANVALPFHKVENNYYDVWDAISSKLDFLDTVKPNDYIDNGAGLNWSGKLSGKNTVTVEHETSFGKVDRVEDTDGDGLPNSWETSDTGVDIDGDGKLDTPPLKKMGADPNKKDVFVQIDWAPGGAWVNNSLIPQNIWQTQYQGIALPGWRNFKPNQNQIKRVTEIFAKHDINLHVDFGPDSIDYANGGRRWGELGKGKQLAESSNNFDIRKASLERDQNLSRERQEVFHYALFVECFAANNGKCEGTSTGQAWMPGDTLIVSAGLLAGDEEGNTFMHELGHNLGLGHGGGDGLNYKPNYISVMNYAFQLRGLQDGIGGIQTEYSTQKLPTINENDLDEGKGVDPDKQYENKGINKEKGEYRTELSQMGTSWFCPSESNYGSNSSIQNSNKKVSGNSLDFNCNGRIDNHTKVDLASNDANKRDEVFEQLNGYYDWGNLTFKGGGIGAMGAVVPETGDIPNELSTETAIEKDILAYPGTARTELVGPFTVIANTSGQKLMVDVENESHAARDFTVDVSEASGELLGGSKSSTVHVDGSTKFPLTAQRVSIPVRADAKPGTYTVKVKATGPSGIVTENSFTVKVVSLTDQQKQQLIDALKKDDAGLPADVADQYRTVLGSATKPADTAKPVISGAVNTEITAGDAFDPLKNVTASDNTDGNVTDSITVDGKVDANQPGEYKLTYTVTDKAGNKATVVRTVTVKAKPAVPPTDQPDKEIAPAAPSQTDNTVTIPDIEGVTYVDEAGKPISGTVTLTKDLTITAKAKDGYAFKADTATQWVFKYQKPVTPVPPSDKPGDKPSDKPSSRPSDKPSTEPSEKPSTNPSDESSDKPGKKPDNEATSKPEISAPAVPSDKSSSADDFGGNQQSGNSGKANASDNADGNAKRLSSTGVAIVTIGAVSGVLLVAGIVILIARRRRAD